MGQQVSDLSVLNVSNYQKYRGAIVLLEMQKLGMEMHDTVWEIGYAKVKKSNLMTD